jgi:hypothetical protein
VALEHLRPSGPVVASERGRHAVAQRTAFPDHRLEECLRSRLASIEMRRLRDHAPHLSGRRERQQQRDDRAVAVAPQHRPLEAEGLDDRACLVGGPVMEV